MTSLYRVKRAAGFVRSVAGGRRAAAQRTRVRRARVRRSDGGDPGQAGAAGVLRGDGEGAAESLGAGPQVGQAAAPAGLADADPVVDDVQVDGVRGDPQADLGPGR